MRPTLGSPWTVVRSAVRDAASHCTRPRRTLAGLAVTLLAPVAAVATLAAPGLVAVAALAAAAGLLAGRRGAGGGDGPGLGAGRRCC